MTYHGPVIDVHHHLWDLSMGRHPWLTPEGGPTSLGDLAYLRRDYLPTDFEADSAGQNIAATVCVEALWDRMRDPFEEVAWWDTLPRRDGIAARYVAEADLTAPSADARLARLAAHPRVAGVRQTIRWHPDPARRWTEGAPIDDPDWQRSVASLPEHGLLLELLMYPWQADAVSRLAARCPEVTMVVNHCSSPIDRDPAGIARWREGLAAMAQAPNVSIKLSNVPAYADEPTTEGARAVVQPIVAAFGAERCLWGSDYPVARRTLPYGATVTLFRSAIADLAEGKQQAILFGNAARLYGLSVIATDVDREQAATCICLPSQP